MPSGDFVNLFIYASVFKGSGSFIEDKICIDENKETLNFWIVVKFSKLFLAWM